MEFIRANTYEIEMRINAEDAKILADACEIAADHATNKGQEDLRNQLTLWQGFLRAGAVAAVMDFAMLEDSRGECDQVLQELGLSEFVRDGRKTLGEFVESAQE